MLKDAGLKSVSFLKELFIADEDAARIHGSLSKLARHFTGPVVVTGGIALGWHLSRNGVRREKRRFNDIDLVVEGLSDLRATLSQDFLVRHFHPHRERGKILLMLVDEEHSTRIDIFTQSTGRLVEQLTDISIGDTSCQVVSAEDLLVKLLGVIYPATLGESVEPKYFEHFNALYTVADLDVAREVWRECRKESQRLEFDEAAEVVRRNILADPGLLRETAYSQDITQTCPWCCESKLFPLAPLSRIYKVLGYV